MNGIIAVNVSAQVSRRPHFTAIGRSFATDVSVFVSLQILVLAGDFIRLITFSYWLLWGAARRNQRVSSVLSCLPGSNPSTLTELPNLAIQLNQPTFLQRFWRFCHRWRRVFRLSEAASGSLSSLELQTHRKEDTIVGRRRKHLPTSGRHLTANRISISTIASNHLLESISPDTQSAMFTAPSTGTAAESSLTMNSPAFHKHDSELEEKLKRRLRFFFLNPVQKWVANRRFPFKLFTQIVKIIFVTVQLCLFASFRDSHVFYARNTEVAFSHMFLKDWDMSDSDPPYPKAAGPLSVYNKQEYYEFLDFAIQNYISLKTDAMGAYFHYPNPSGNYLTYCQTNYYESKFNPTDNRFKFNSRTAKMCVDISINEDPASFSSEEFLRSNNMSVNGQTLVEASLSFSIKAIHFRPNELLLNSPDCYLFNLKLVFSDQDEDGQLQVFLVPDTEYIHCEGEIDPPVSDSLSKTMLSIVNYIVIFISLFSFILCVRAVFKAQVLKWETNAYFQRHFNRQLSSQDRMEFLNLWYVLIIANDILLVAGSIIKELMERQHVSDSLWDICSVLLGTGNLFVWFGVLRYLGFFRTYNMLIITLKKAFPSVLRFLLCALLIYAGFLFCGWLIFGPYHSKFQTISSTSECLFSLINGDDMFPTFAGMSERSVLIWWVSRIYLYTFISLFIYVVLSLFIALIMDTYETIKMYYTEGFPKSDLRQFIANDDSIESQPVYEPQDCFPKIWMRIFGRNREEYETIAEE